MAHSLRTRSVRLTRNRFRDVAWPLDRSASRLPAVYTSIYSVARCFHLDYRRRSTPLTHSRSRLRDERVSHGIECYATWLLNPATFHTWSLIPTPRRRSGWRGNSWSAFGVQEMSSWCSSLLVETVGDRSGFLHLHNRIVAQRLQHPGRVPAHRRLHRRRSARCASWRSAQRSRIRRQIRDSSPETAAGTRCSAASMA